jgi:hypothetical protein
LQELEDKKYFLESDWKYIILIIQNIKIIQNKCNI